MRSSRSTPVDGTTVDLLEREDREVFKLFSRLDETRGPSVDDRATHDLAQQLIRHVTTREAALTDVVVALADVPALSDVVDRIDFLTEDRRMLTNRLEHMSRRADDRGLHATQDFDGAMADLARLMRAEIDWELSNAIPTIRDFTERASGAPAPTPLRPLKSRRHERAPVLSRVVTFYDRLRDFPGASKGHWD